jgi:hypothetical protein
MARKSNVTTPRLLKIIYFRAFDASIAVSLVVISLIIAFHYFDFADGNGFRLSALMPFMLDTCCLFA